MSNEDALMNEATPLAFHLSQNYPNPFREKTQIKYCVAYETMVQLTVLNSAGEVIDKLVDEEKKAGTYEIDFVACAGPSGEKRYLAGGTYYYRIQAGDFVQTRKLVILE